MDKADLRKAARELATIEVLERICKPEERSDLERKRIAKLKETNRIRASIDELAGREYWWDISYDAEHPPYIDPDGYYIPNSFYVEYGDIVTSGVSPHIRVQIEEDKMAVSQFLRIVKGGITGNDYRYTALFLDKKLLRQNLTASMDIRVLYNLSYEGIGLSSLSFGPEDYINMAGVDEVIGRVNALEQARLGASASDWKNQLERLNNRWDLMERITHNSLLTNEQRYMRGGMDTMEYFRESSWREYDIQSKQEKELKFQEQIRAEAMHERLRLQEMQSKALSRSMQRESVRANYIHIIPVCEIYYLNGRIAAICAYKEKQIPMDAACSTEIDLSNLAGTWTGIRKGDPVHPNRYKLYNYLIGQYSRYLPPYNVLSARPTGASDAEWRAWAELRFMNELLE